MGVDEAVGEVPFDSFAAASLKPAPRRAPEAENGRQSAARRAKSGRRNLDASHRRRSLARCSELQALVAGFGGLLAYGGPRKACALLEAASRPASC